MVLKNPKYSQNGKYPLQVKQWIYASLKKLEIRVNSERKIVKAEKKKDEVKSVTWITGHWNLSGSDGINNHWLYLAMVRE